MRLLTIMAVSFLLWYVPGLMTAEDATETVIRQALVSRSTALHTAGESLLLREAEIHQYVLLGELHGEVEVPQLISELWPHLWQAGYRHVGAEVSPWAATHLTRSAEDDATPVPGLWTRQQAADVSRLAAQRDSVLWGCDIEEEQPDQLIRQMARLNPADSRLRAMLQIVSHGYSRKSASELLHLGLLDQSVRDAQIGGASLWKSTLDTLKVEALRSDPHSRYLASSQRERVMKDLFLRQRKRAPQGKVLLRFGRNHLHRGFDARGVSTLGNFVVEWALARGESAVNIGVFAAGGKEHLAGQTFDADERQDELTFALLANLAKSEPTLFDLRDVRPLLHDISADKRTSLEGNLTYWADSYDFLLCYPKVSPLMDSSADPR